MVYSWWKWKPATLKMSHPKITKNTFQYLSVRSGWKFRVDCLACCCIWEYRSLSWALSCSSSSANSVGHGWTATTYGVQMITVKVCLISNTACFVSTPAFWPLYLGHPLDPMAKEAAARRPRREDSHCASPWPLAPAETWAHSPKDFKA